MKKRLQREIGIWADWDGLDQPSKVGMLFATPSRSKEIFSFEYDRDWLSRSHTQPLDPGLGLYRGQQYPPAGKENFGAFLDSAPDRWGRVLMDRREALLARAEGRPERPLLESDYLLGVCDAQRMGALRFRLTPDGPFLSDNAELACPPWTYLRELERASLELEQPDAERKPRYGKWLGMLVAPGSSLGGARPKSSVLGKKGDLWLAKFPSRSDGIDVGAWEAVVFRLARRAGISIPAFELHKFGAKHHTLLSKRFDRTARNKRIHFASALTLLQRSDGDDASAGASYLELVQFIQRGGANPKSDLEQLWRRIVFFICISNTDDHLRNHGFLLTPAGWSLSPAYDINPNPHGEGLTLNISESDNSLDLELARSVSEYFRVGNARSKEIISDVINVVKTWKKVASSLKIPAEEQSRMRRAFNRAE